MEDMSTDETYEGWKNRETWAFNLHWSNDQGLYNDTLEQARAYLTETYGDDWASMREDEMLGAFWGVGEHVIKYWRDFINDYEEDFGAELPDGLKMFRDEVGSWWRVDEAETGAAVRESLS
jgi:hypothetical protein